MSLIGGLVGDELGVSKVLLAFFGGIDCGNRITARYD
jgi:hypothetical protein